MAAPSRFATDTPGLWANLFHFVADTLDKSVTWRAPNIPELRADPLNLAKNTAEVTAAPARFATDTPGLWANLFHFVADTFKALDYSATLNDEHSRH